MSSVLPAYRRSHITITKGQGAYLYAPDGTRYLDFAAGIAVNSLGHCHPHVVAALKAQADELWHCSNMYQMPGLSRLAERLCAESFADKAFFCNSGSEAVECGLKMLRRYQDHVGKPERYRVITMTGGFHGRTLACISAGGNDIARIGFEPLMPGFDRAEYNNLASVEAAITTETAAILMEPIQGEGGLNSATPEFLSGLRALCDRHGLLLFIDEVQCGMGRTGSLFTHDQMGVKPDIVSAAKGIGTGFPLAACLMTDKVAACVTPGSHGSTYGSNPLAMAVGNAVLDVMLAPGFFPHVTAMGARLKSGLDQLVADLPQHFTETRGRGLMLGIRAKNSAGDLVAAFREAHLLTSTAEGNMIRITPPLIIDETHVDEALRIMRHAATQ